MGELGSMGNDPPPPTKADTADVLRRLNGMTEAETTEFRRRQRVKNLALFAVLLALALLFYAISMVKFKVS